MKVFIKEDNFKKILVRRNISQTQFGYSIGISSGYMSQLVTGQRCPSAQVRKRIQESLQIDSFDYLFRIEAE